MDMHEGDRKSSSYVLQSAIMIFAGLITISVAFFDEIVYQSFSIKEWMCLFMGVVLLVRGLLVAKTALAVRRAETKFVTERSSE